MRVIAVVSSKGGVGKTTLASALAVRAARENKRVAMVDLDPQRRAAVRDLSRLPSTRRAQSRRWRARARGAQLGFHAAAERPRAEARREHAGRQGADEVLANVVRVAAMPRAGVVLLRAEG